MSNRATCKHCGHPIYTIMRRKIKGDSIQVIKVCDSCNKMWDVDFVSQEGINVFALPWHNPADTSALPLFNLGDDN